MIDAANSDVKAKIPATHGKEYAAEEHPIGGIGPRNTWMNPDGTRVYRQVLTVPYVFIADTRTNQAIGKVGPFSKGLRRFTVTDDEKLVFANVDWLLGFEVGSTRTGDQWAARCSTAWRPHARIAAGPDAQTHYRATATTRREPWRITVRFARRTKASPCHQRSTCGYETKLGGPIESPHIRPYR